jgi:hypothetical protein
MYPLVQTPRQLHHTGSAPLPAAARGAAPMHAPRGAPLELTVARVHGADPRDRGLARHQG